MTWKVGRGSDFRCLPWMEVSYSWFDKWLVNNKKEKLVCATNAGDAAFQVLSTAKHQLLSTEDESLRSCIYPKAHKHAQQDAP